MQSIRIYIIALSFLLSAAIGGFSQDANFSQFYYNPVYFNPALVGINNDLEVRSSFRQHWPGLNGGFSNSTLSADFYEPIVMGGLGAQMISSFDNGGMVKNHAANFSYAYRLPLIRNKMFLQMGLQAGVVYKKMNCDNLVFSGQLDPIYGDMYTSSFCNTDFAPVIYPDFATGAALVFNINKNYSGRAAATNTIGVAFHHLTRPNESFVGQDARLPVRTVVHMQSIIPIAKGRKDVMMLAPALIYERQGTFENTTFGMNAILDPLIVGLWVRNENLKLQKEKFTSLILMVGMTIFDQTKYKMQVTYSYDINASRLQTATSGSHEIGIRYSSQNFKLSKKKKPSLKSRARSNKHCYNSF